MALYSYSSDSSDSENIVRSKCLDLSYLMLDSATLEHNLQIMAHSDDGSRSKDAGDENSAVNRSAEAYETLLLCHNQLNHLPDAVCLYRNLRVLNISSNNLTAIPPVILTLQNLTSLIAKHNALNDDSIPKDFGQMTLKEINFSGNSLTRIPEQILEISALRFLYIGGNRIAEVPKDIIRLSKLQVLYMGGNRLTEIPAEVGYLKSLQALVLCENQIEFLPSSIANLNRLRSLLLHKNNLTTLPPEIVSLKGLMELSLRDNPLVVRFVRDMTYNPPTLLELSARVIKMKNLPVELGELPRSLVSYLSSAHHCVNPKCRGVYFDNRVEHIKFVDFCGKYRIPLLQYLCSPRCSTQPAYCETDSDSDPEDRIRKVLLG